MSSRSRKSRGRVGSLPRQSATDTAEALLAAGERIVRRYVVEGPSEDQKPVDILAFVDIERVLAEATEIRRQAAVERGHVSAKRRIAPLTTGAFYRAFPPPGGRRGPRRKGEALAIFRRELGRRIVSADVYRQDVSRAEDTVLSAETLANERTFYRVCRAETAHDIYRWRDSPTDLLFYALMMHAKDDEVSSWLREVNDRALDAMEAFWRKVLPRIGRRCRPGVSERQLGAVIRAVLAIMPLEGRVPGSPTMDTVTVTEADPALAGTWPLASIVVEGVFKALTEQVDQP